MTPHLEDRIAKLEHRIAVLHRRLAVAIGGGVVAAIAAVGACKSAEPAPLDKVAITSGDQSVVLDATGLRFTNKATVTTQITHTEVTTTKVSVHTSGGTVFATLEPKGISMIDGTNRQELRSATLALDKLGPKLALMNGEHNLTADVNTYGDERLKAKASLALRAGNAATLEVGETLGFELRKPRENIHAAIEMEQARTCLVLAHGTDPHATDVVPAKVSRTCAPR